jgi:uncharacterized membrane protein
MDEISIARAVHVVAVLHWIGGVSLVTLVLLPSLMHSVPPVERLNLFERIEGRFARQAKISTVLAGLTGFYMTQRLEAWDRLSEPSFWWMHAMIAVWAIFTFVLFIAEPLFLHRWVRDRATRDPEGTILLVWRMHVLLLLVSFVTVAGAVLGAHGALA